MRTLTVKKTSGGFTDKFPPGWHTLSISGATYGNFQDSKFIDLTFNEYPENNIKCRIWAKEGQDGEEFAIGRLFRFANAGITSVSKSDDGEAIVQIDDSPASLLNKKVNCFFYKGSKGYTECLGMIAPTEFENDLEAYSADDVNFWKTKTEKYYKDFVAKSSEESNGFVQPATEKVSDKPSSEAELPW